MNVDPARVFAEQPAVPPGAARRRSIPVWVDVAIALLLATGAAIGGLSYWKRATANGQPFYYQNYFEPAVMIACGKGFVVARPQVPSMVPFLWQKTDRFACDAIGPDAPLGTDDMFQQGSWRYLMLAVGWTWRLFGVSWSALGPLFALLFGATAAVLYVVFRLGMRPLLAAAGAIFLCFSAMHLRYLLVLRDYTKAPFTLALVVLLGLLVKGGAARRRTLAIAAAYGVVLGIGYGFRTDFLGDVPPFFVALFLFLEGGVSRNIRAKAAAAAVCAAAFLVTAAPVLASISRSRPGCEWHVVLLGFAQPFASPMGVRPAPYEVNREYLDEFAYTNVTSYAARRHPGVGHIDYCEATYGAATREYLFEVVRRFPADVIVRAYASAMRIAELPFTDRANEDVDDQAAHNAAYGLGLPLVVAAILVAAASSVRIGLFLAFFTLYFGGLPATQFDARHFFHLEFMALWAAGFLVESAIAAARPLIAHRTPPIAAGAVRRALLAGAGCVAALVAVLWVARAYQQASARTLLAGYLAATRDPVAPAAGVAAVIPASLIRTAAHTDPETADLVAVDLDASRCGERASVAFRYADEKRRPYSRVFDVGRQQQPGGLTHILMPVYDGFGELAFADAPPGCVQGIFRVREPGQFSLLPEVLLRPGWRREPLYQQLRVPRRTAVHD